MMRGSLRDSLRGSLSREQGEEKGDGWSPYGDADFDFNPELLKKGIFAVRPYDETAEFPTITSNSFFLKDRELHFAADVDDDSELKEEFQSFYPKQAAELFSKMPELNPYKEWDIYIVEDITKIKPETIPGKAIILTPTLLQKKETKNAKDPAVSSQKNTSDAKNTTKANFKTAYFVKHGRLLSKNGKDGAPLASEINLLSLTPEEKKLIENQHPAQTKQIKLSKENASNTHLDSSNQATQQPLPAGLSTQASTENPLIAQIAKKILSKDNISPFDVFIRNINRRDEIFVLVDEVGLYVHSWTPPLLPEEKKKEKLKPNKNDNANEVIAPNNFVTAVCMFGPTLKGYDDGGNEFILIKHDKKFFNEQKIVKIKFNPKADNPYETMLFGELEKQIQLIKKIADPSKPTTLHVHLPYIDYMLFGTELFIRGRMTLPALGHFFKCILKKRKEYIHKVNDLCGKNSVMPIIESPFENLFGSLSIENLTQTKNNETILAETILNTLGLKSDEVAPSTIDEKQQKENEKEFVLSILKKLKTHLDFDNNQNHHFNTDQERTSALTRQQVWQDLQEASEMQQKQDEQDVYAELLNHLKSQTKDTQQQQSWAKSLQNIQQMESTHTLNLQDVLDQLKLEAMTLGDSETRNDEVQKWNDLSKLLNRNRINNLEDLFKLANAVELGIASHGSPANGTGSLLPLTENRIPIEYNNLRQQRMKMELKAWSFVISCLKEKNINDLDDLYHAAKEPANVQTAMHNLKQYALAKLAENPNQFDGLSENLIVQGFEKLQQEIDDYCHHKVAEEEAERFIKQFTNSIDLTNLSKEDKIKFEEKFKTALPSNLSFELVRTHFGKLIKQAKDTNKEEKVNRAESTTLISSTLEQKQKQLQTKKEATSESSSSSFNFSSPYNATFNLSNLDPVVTYVPIVKEEQNSSPKSAPTSLAKTSIDNNRKQKSKKSETNENSEAVGANSPESGSTQGQLFYFDQCQTSLKNCLASKGTTIYNNARLFSYKVKGKEAPDELQQQLTQAFVR